ncbi:MAG: M56 family metallopeptidase [Bacteroidota bacterium]
MNALLFYLLQSSLSLGALFAVYWVFLRRDTFFQTNRVYLLLSGLLSAVMPLLPFHQVMRQPASALVVLLEPVLITPGSVEVTVLKHLQWFEIIQVVYLTGVVIFLARYLFQLYQLSRLVRRSSIRRSGGYRLVSVDRGYAPFSFFNMIFISENKVADDTREAILAHEQIHIRQAHSLDLVISELMIIIQWFNPFTWLTVRELKNIHEYLADEGVIKKGMPLAGYQQIILNETLGIQVNNLTNNFNISQLKKRIVMMTQKRSGSWAIGKIVLALPVIMTLLLLFSAGTFSIALPQDKSKQEPKSMGVPVKVIDTKHKFQVPDKQPGYPGGEEARMKFLVENIKYPELALKNNVAGKVFVGFNVETDGSITNVKVLRGIGSGCDEEAVRVIKMMPKWIPGELKGNPIETNFVIPIKFALKADKIKTTKQEIKFTPVPADIKRKEKKMP